MTRSAHADSIQLGYPTDADELRAELEEYRTGIARIGQVCLEAAQGNLESRILGVATDGPLGEIALRVNHLLDLSDAFVREASASLQHASAGQFYRRVLVRGMLGTYRNAAVEINRATEAMEKGTRQLAETEQARQRQAEEFSSAMKVVVNNIASTATEARATAQLLAGTAGQTKEKSTSVSTASEDVSRSMGSVAAAAEEITATVGEIERQAAETQGISADAVRAAEQTNETVAGLAEASSKINRVVKLINDISGQTRLLALNATIEAARAGELGRGFAVVATEVKDLATKTTEATHEIDAQVRSIQSAVGDTVSAVEGIGGTIRRVHGLSSAVSEAAQAQRAATGEINRNIQDAARGTREVSDGIAAVSGAVHDTSEAARHMLATADELSRMAEELRARWSAPS